MKSPGIHEKGNKDGKSSEGKGRACVLEGGGAEVDEEIRRQPARGKGPLGASQGKRTTGSEFSPEDWGRNRQTFFFQNHVDTHCSEKRVFPPQMTHLEH